MPRRHGYSRRRGITRGGGMWAIVVAFIATIIGLFLAPKVGLGAYGVPAALAIGGGGAWAAGHRAAGTGLLAGAGALMVAPMIMGGLGGQGQQTTPAGMVWA